MRAVVATSVDLHHPLTGLAVQDVGERETPEGWVRIRVHAASLNHHDLWTLRGLTPRPRDFPTILGTDAAGTTEDGQAWILYPVLSTGILLSEGSPGTMAEFVDVPRANLVPKPDGLTFEEAACLPTSYLTAYHMLFGKARARPGESVLIQGAGGGVSTAAILLASRAGLEVTVAGRDHARLERARSLGAHHTITVGDRLREHVDIVLETVGEATWAHSLKSVRPGGRVVVAGATSGFNPPADLPSLFLRDVDVCGAYMGTAEELGLMARWMANDGPRPVIDSVRPLAEAPSAFAAMDQGDVFGKLILEVS